MPAKKYQLDPHCEAILEEYREHLPQFEQVKNQVLSLLKEVFEEAGLIVASIEGRVKTEGSLA